ncbi:MAG: ABC transporter permease [Ruminococcus sp.]|uniref:ABC transporter permease n=1 Tax=Ruminococcus sp. TaxID=41978 RepID=UPI001B2963CC|nr:ABC transporter permease [Ruminococcus sp.]MBO7474452.1 ABC transporter permease [Ruminococcus sp.]
MQVFKAMLRVMKKRLPSAMIYVVVFIVVSVIVSSAATKDNSFEASRLRICIFDEDDTPESHALAEFIGKSNDIVEIENDKDAIIDALYYQWANYALIINKGYAGKIAAGDTSDLFSSYCLDERFSTVYMGQLLNEYAVSVKAYTTMGMTVTEAVSCTEEVLEQNAEVSMLRADNGGDSHFSVDFAAYFQYMPYILISVIISVVSMVLVIMNRKDVRYRTNCSSMRNSSYTFQIFLGSFLFVFVIWLLLIIVGAVLNEEMYTGRAWLAVLNSFILSMVIAALAVLISSFEPKDNLLSLITQVAGLGMSFFCGVFIPLEVLSDKVAAAARFLPVYWYIRANNMIAETEAYSFRGVMQCYMIQIAFAAALVLITLLVRRVRYSGAAISTTVRKAAVR